MGGEKQRQISYAYFSGFISLINNLELVKKIYMAVTRRDETKLITKGEVFSGINYYYSLIV